MAKTHTWMWVGAGVVGLGVVYWYRRQQAEQKQDADRVACGMELSYPNGLKNVRVKIGEYQSSPDCLRLLGEYVEQYHPAEYQKLVMAGEMNNDQAQAALEVDKQEVAMALNMLETAAVGVYRPINVRDYQRRQMKRNRGRLFRRFRSRK